MIDDLHAVPPPVGKSFRRKDYCKRGHLFYYPNIVRVGKKNRCILCRAVRIHEKAMSTFEISHPENS